MQTQGVGGVEEGPAISNIGVANALNKQAKAGTHVALGLMISPHLTNATKARTPSFHVTFFPSRYVRPV